MSQTLLVNEIFLSLQGESTFQGKLCAFVRLAGCHLRCKWCDTTYAFANGKTMVVEEVAEEVLKMGSPLVEITGGEPLLQEGTYALMDILLKKGLKVLLETSGSLRLEEVPAKVKVIMDIKPPGSGEERRNCWDNLLFLKQGDEVKFVLASREDYVWAKEVCKKENLPRSGVEVLFSVAYGVLSPREVANWVVEDKLGVRFQLQQHKYIWGAEARGV